ncbi:hypothetical protein [Streptomyces sp. NPDC059538]
MLKRPTTFIDVLVPADPTGVRLTVADDGRTESGARGTTMTWESAL